jgi:hypothetical protein
MRDPRRGRIVRYLWRLTPSSARRDSRRPAPRAGGARPRVTLSGRRAASSLRRDRRGGGGAARRRRRAAASRAHRRRRRVRQVKREEPKVGRNDSVAVRAGKKYKKCHGANA